jgi:nitrogenase molybdenum-iron protein alpha/beta subunit
MLANLNLRVNYVIDLASVDDLAQLSSAAATVGFCYTLSSYMAAALEQHFGVPEIKAPMPYGFVGTDAWLREIGKVTHREELAEIGTCARRAAYSGIKRKTQRHQRVCGDRFRLFACADSGFTGIGRQCRWVIGLPS